MTQHDIADRNVERLLGVAYKPEPIDPAFVQEVEERLVRAAHEIAVAPQSAPVDVARLVRLRRRLGWAMATAAGVALFFLIRYAVKPVTKPDEVAHIGTGAHGVRPARLTDKKQLDVSGLTAKPRPDAAKPEAVAVGETLTTKHGERRRIALTDGSVLYVNENTAFSYTTERQVRLDRGEIYVEVAPRPSGDKFMVLTPDRQVVALGTHFRVAATAAGSGVLVTQGTVKVSDVAGDVPAGQQVAPGKKQATAAPRASHVLDWLKPLVAAADGSLVPGTKHDGGALIAIDPNGQELQLTLRKYHIDVHLEDGFARTTIDQTYFNNTWSRLEGTFYFPLPPDASLSRLAMYVLDGKDCKLMEGGMAERAQAANAYETIRYERRDPALLEWVDGSTFKMRVFPLEAWQEKRIVLSYTQRLPSLYGVAKYRFPGGHNMQIVRDWSFEAHVANANHWDVLTPSHPDMKRSDAGPTDGLTLRTAAKLIKPDEDVVLELREREAPPEGATFATHLQDGQRYFMARYRPKLDTKPQRQRRDWIVLFESSANRDPFLARTQIEVFRNLLKNVEYDDTFSLLTCNARLSEFGAKPQAATPANVQAAVEFLEKTHLIGGCDLEQGLRKALEYAKEAKNPHLVHLGAGVPSLGEVKDDVLARLIPDNVTYVGVGVGKKWNREFMKMVADRTGGYFTQINPDEPVAWRTFDLAATLNTPRLLDVRVVDPDEKVTYLADAVTLAQGEEICAFARGPVDSLPLPKRVLITGRLDGKRFQREIDVRQPNETAGFLPRTWAKLEIDRLLADGQDKNKAAITELSKAMYVMSPFTSLLVLENEADYQRFGIDRGRKDHWAMYACPERIPQVYEPDPLYTHWWGHVEQAKEGQKPSTEQVLDTILVRIPPQYIFPSGRQYSLPYSASARQMLMAGAAAVSIDADDFGDLVVNREAERLSLGDRLGRATWAGRDGTWSLEDGKAIDSRTGLRRFQPDRPRLVGSLGRSVGRAGKPGVTRFLEEGRQLLRLQNESMPWGEGETNSLSLFERSESRLTDLAPRRKKSLSILTEDLGELVDESRSVRSRGLAGGLRGSLLAAVPASPERGVVSLPFLMAGGTKKEGQKELLFDRELSWFGNWLPGAANLMISSLDGVKWSAAGRERYADAWMLQLAADLHTRESSNWLAYQQPQQQIDQRLFGDLTIYAPGFLTTWADMQNTVAEEATPEQAPAAGKIDDAARAVFDKARQVGWHAVVYPGVGRIPGVKVIANGRGQFAYERTLSSGLVERVICDGQTLWHLYPEIGLGTRRPFSRHHFGELSRWVPWILPRAEDLALGADLRGVDAQTVALVPHRQPATNPSKEVKQETTREVHLAFTADGDLAETRLVEMPSGKVLARQTFGRDGTIRLLDDAGKQVAEHKLPRETAAAPNLKPALDELVVVDMPLRLGAYWDQRIAKHTTEKNEAALQADHLGLFAAACLGRIRDALPIFGEYFHAKGDKRLGFYTLLSACDRHFLKQPNTWAPGIVIYDPVQEHPQSPLARYLAHHQKNLQPHYNADPDLLEDLPGRADSFVARITAFRNAWNMWRHHQFRGNRDEVYAREKRKLMEFLRINTSPLIAFVLECNLSYLNTHDRADVAKLIYETQKDYVHPMGMGYVFGYQAAYSLYHKGEYKEASRLYRELYEQAVKENVVPKIDGTFRNVLDDARSQGPNFGAFMRGVVHDFLKKDQPHLAILTAMQASHVGGQTLGDELFQYILQRLPEKTDRLVLVAAVEYLVQDRLNGRPSAIDGRADALRDRLLADAEVASKPAAWRLSAALAEHREQTPRSLADLEKALDLEYRQMGDLINLEAVRQDYRNLLSQYMQIAKAARTLQQDAPADLVARVVKAADRWRGIDSDSREVCQTTAAILKLLGAKDLAWDYQTTPVALRPNEAGPWVDLAQQLRADGELAQADHAYSRAFLSESTNPQILWDRAQNLLQMGRVTEARALWQQIADGRWQERFQPLVPQARWHLEHN